MPAIKRLATQVSRTVIRQQRPSVDVETSALTNAEEVAVTLEPFLRQGLPEGATLPDMALFQVILGNIVGHHAEQMEAADEAHFAALSRLNHFRLVRDDLLGIVLPKMVDFRDSFDAAFGPNTCQRILGLGSRIPRDALTVRRLGDRVVGRLTAPDFELPPRRSESVSLDPELWVAELTPGLDGLRDTLHRLSEARRLADRTLEAKNRAVNTYSNTYSWCTFLLETLYRMGGRDHLADRLRPPRRSRSPQTEVTPAVDSTADPATEATAEDEAEEEVDGESEGEGNEGEGGDGEAAAAAAAVPPAPPPDPAAGGRR